jgi:hypothetical protein
MAEIADIGAYGNSRGHYAMQEMGRALVRAKLR